LVPYSPVAHSLTKANASIEVEPTACTVCGSAAAKVEARGKDYLYQTSDQSYSFVRCQSCGHLYLNPRPTIKEICRLYPKEYATFARRFSGPRSVLAAIKDRVLMRRFESLSTMLPTEPRILDVGCGDARFLMTLRRRYPSAMLVGLDWWFGPGVADDMKAANIKTLCGTIETVDLGENYYDLIVMNQLIEHVWDVRLVVNRCRRALKLGGLLAIETPNPEGWDRSFFRSGAWGGYYWPRHLNLFSRKHLARVIEEGGLEVIQTSSLLSPPCWISSCRAVADRAGFGSWSGKVFSDTNTFWLAVFAAVDWTAMRSGAETSNQKMMARRASA
jgi:SAM-dependent methyltransferase